MMLLKILISSVLIAATAVPAFALEANAVNNVDKVALKGFDPVAYFLDNKPRKGDPGITSKYQGVIYEFVNEDHKVAFEKEPGKYIPTFNGFCAFGVTHGHKLDIDPHDYSIDEGKLNVFFDDGARDDFEADYKKNNDLAEKNWPQVKKLTKIIR
jgi:hypothetical protein